MEERVEDKSFFVSSLEKTLIDSLTYPQHCGGLDEASKALWNSREEADWEMLLNFLERLDVSAVTRRMGYIVEVLEIKKEFKEKLKRDFNGYRWFDPSTSKGDFTRCKKWRLKLNLSEEEMLGWRKQ